MRASKAYMATISLPSMTNQWGLRWKIERKSTLLSSMFSKCMRLFSQPPLTNRTTVFTPGDPLGKVDNGMTLEPCDMFKSVKGP